MELYMLVAREQHRSRLNDCDYYRFTWIRLSDLTIWETTVDSTYRNWQRRGWQQLSLMPNPYGIYTGLRPTTRTTAQGWGILTADSRAELVEAVRDQDQACDIITAIKEQQ